MINKAKLIPILFIAPILLLCGAIVVPIAVVNSKKKNKKEA